MHAAIAMYAPRIKGCLVDSSSGEEREETPAEARDRLLNYLVRRADLRDQT